MATLFGAFLDRLVPARELLGVKETVKKFQRFLWGSFLCWLIMSRCWYYWNRKRWLFLVKNVNLMLYTSLGSCWMLLSRVLQTSSLLMKRVNIWRRKKFCCGRCCGRKSWWVYRDFSCKWRKCAGLVSFRISEAGNQLVLLQNMEERKKRNRGVHNHLDLGRYSIHVLPISLYKWGSTMYMTLSGLYSDRLFH